MFETSVRGKLVQCPDGAYDFDQINGLLSDNPELSDAVAIASVESCEDARDFSIAHNDFIESFPPLPEVEGPQDDFRIASADGANLTTSGVLEIRRGNGKFNCTGVLINPSALITAAHCVAPFAPDGQRNFWETNYHIKNFGGGVFDGTVRINIHPDYSGPQDTGDDIAVIKVTTGDFGFDPAGLHRIFKGYLSDMGWIKLYGRGVTSNEGGGSGNLRWMHYLPDWSNSQYFLMDADSSRRTCSGDSGGPIMDNLPGTSTRVVAGLHVNSEKFGDNRCAVWNGKQRAVRLQHKIRWIDDMLGGNDHDDCIENDNGGWPYERCW